MPLSYSIPAVGRRSDALKKRALQSIPPDARDPARAQEELLAVVWGLLLVDCQLSLWLRMTMIGTAVGVWLDAHGDTYGKLRRKDEPDDAYRARIPKVELACTPTAVLGVADDVLEGDGIVGDAFLVEIWATGVHCDSGSCDNTEEVCGPGPSFLLILPPSIPESVARSVYDAADAVKVGGTYHRVFPSVTGGHP